MAERAAPFVRFNCAAFSKDEAEAELFGPHSLSRQDRAVGSRSLLEEAREGSLFLEKIDEMAQEIQGKLLRLLDERRFRRSGTRDDIEANVRLISSISREPEAAVKDHRLREDLFYRLGAMTLRVPPLRDRREDLRPLAEYFVRRYAAKHGKHVQGASPKVYELLALYSWPGNVRELEHVVEQAVLVARRDAVTEADLPERVTKRGQLPRPKQEPTGDLNLEHQEREAIIRALEAANWNKQAAAAMLGLHRPTLYSKMRKHGISKGRLA